MERGSWRRLRPLTLQVKLERPLPYAKVPQEDLWECNYCPIRELCYSEATKEARAEWEKGNDVERITGRKPRTLRSVFEQYRHTWPQ